MTNCTTEGFVKGDISCLRRLVLDYEADKGTLPRNLRITITVPPIDPYRTYMGASDPLRILIDRWERPYQYRVPGTKSTDGFDVFSLGPDGKEGTKDDIGNWDSK